MNLKLRLIHIISEWRFPQLSDSICVRRHRHKPQPPPLCCQLLPAQQSKARWCHWTLFHHPLLLRVENSLHWGWRWTSAKTCCRCTENPWRLRSHPGNAARKTEKEAGFRLKSSNQSLKIKEIIWSSTLCANMSSVWMNNKYYWNKNDF